MRLTRRPDGGFRLEGVAAAPLDGVPHAGGFGISAGADLWDLSWIEEERGWILSSTEGGSAIELGRTTSSGPEPVLSSSSVLLADGRLFRLSFWGAASPRVELGRWDVPGAYVVAEGREGAWELELTVAGTALRPPAELIVLTCIEIGRLDGWYEAAFKRYGKAESR